jgi:hypothetical protein
MEWALSEYLILFISTALSPRGAFLALTIMTAMSKERRIQPADFRRLFGEGWKNTADNHLAALKKELRSV